MSKYDWTMVQPTPLLLALWFHPLNMPYNILSVYSISSGLITVIFVACINLVFESSWIYVGFKETPQQVLSIKKTEVLYNPTLSLLGIYQKGNKIPRSQVHCSISHSTQSLETTSVCQHMTKERKCCLQIHSGLLLKP